MNRHREVERKFDVPPDLPLPDLTPLGAVSEPHEVPLEATYLDTEALTLARHRITLRRRTGGADEGWHLKLPGSDDERVEVRRPLGPDVDRVPPELLDEVRAVLRDLPVRPVALLRTVRIERQVTDGDRALAVVTDDTVRATRLPDGETSGWREVEVELLDGDADVLDAASDLLLSSGLTAATSGSKLARALGEPEPEPADEPPPGTAAAVVVGYLRGQRDELVTRDREARAGDAEGVHKMRVAARRARATLTTFESLFEPAVTGPLRDELRWLGRLLGAVRDTQVQRQRLLATIDSMAEDLLPARGRERIEAELAARQLAALAAARAALDDRRYFRLLDAVDRMVDHPPLTGAALDPADEVLPALVDKAVRRVRRAAGAVSPDLPPVERDARLHEVRKTAKRARYAAEAATPVGGRRAAKLARRMAALQEVLGEHQDSITAQALLRDLATGAADVDEAFAIGVLHGEEVGRGHAARVHYEPALDQALKKKLRRWRTAGH